MFFSLPNNLMWWCTVAYSVQMIVHYVCLLLVCFANTTYGDWCSGIQTAFEFNLFPIAWASTIVPWAWIHSSATSFKSAESTGADLRPVVHYKVPPRSTQLAQKPGESLRPAVHNPMPPLSRQLPWRTGDSLRPALLDQRPSRSTRIAQPSRKSLRPDFHDQMPSL